LDPLKIGDANVDTDENAYQLALACQKIFNVIKQNDSLVPDEFRTIFIKISEVIMMKFGSEEACFKAIGGLLFLRLITPAITAPSSFGLLKEPPNQIAQRQLLLIAKVLQNLANMTLSKKEPYMSNLEDFIKRNIPKIRQFYANLLDPRQKGSNKTKQSLEVPENVRLNSLALLHTYIYNNQAEIRECFKKIDDAEKERHLEGLLDRIIEVYGAPPKKTKKDPKEKDKERALQHIESTRKSRGLESTSMNIEKKSANVPDKPTTKATTETSTPTTNAPKVEPPASSTASPPPTNVLQDGDKEKLITP